MRHADHPRNIPEPSEKKTFFKTFPRLPVPYAFKSGPLNWTPATCTSSQQLLDPTRARTGPVKFGSRTLHRGPKPKKGSKVSLVPVHGVSSSKKKGGSGSHRFAVNNSRAQPEQPFLVRLAAFLIIGQSLVLAVPFETTTMAGRRLRNASIAALHGVSSDRTGTVNLW